MARRSPHAAIQLGVKALGALKAIAAAIVSAKVVLIAVVIVLVIVLLLIIIISAIPGIGHEAEQEEAALCTDGATAVTANVENLPITAAGMNGDQLVNAAIIMQTAEDAGLGREAQLIGLITAIQESNLGKNPAAMIAQRRRRRRNVPAATALWLVRLPLASHQSDLRRPRPVLGVTAEHPSDYGSVGGGLATGISPALPTSTAGRRWRPSHGRQAVQKPAEDYPNEYAKHIGTANRILNDLGDTNVDLGEGRTVAGCAARRRGAATGEVKDVIDTAKTLSPWA